MSEIRRTGSEDECNPGWEDNHDRPDEVDGWPTCDSGRSADCTGVATVVHPVSYLPEALRLCDPCLAWEQQQEANGPSDEQVMNATGTEGGVNYDPDYESRVRR